MAVGSAKGDEAASKAAEQAISSQLLDITIDGAHGILFNVTGGSDLTLYDVNQAAAIIKETAHPDVNLIFGAVIDPAMKDEVRITVIATGFERSGMPHRMTDPKAHEHASEARYIAERTNSVPVAPPTQKQNPDFRPRAFNTEDLDIPTFLRNRSR